MMVLILIADGCVDAAGVVGTNIEANVVVDADADADEDAELFSHGRQIPVANADIDANANIDANADIDANARKIYMHM